MKERIIKDLEEKLYDKAQKEYSSFIEKLKTLSPEKIIDSSYKKVCYDEYLSYFGTENKFNIDELKMLIKTDDLLETFYDDWLSCDGGFHTELEISADDFMLEMLDDYEKENKKQKIQER